MEDCAVCCVCYGWREVNISGGEGGREEGIRVGGWEDRPTWTNKGVRNIHNCTEDYH